MLKLSLYTKKLIRKGDESRQWEVLKTWHGCVRNEPHWPLPDALSSDTSHESDTENICNRRGPDRKSLGLSREYKGIDPLRPSMYKIQPDNWSTNPEAHRVEAYLPHYTSPPKEKNEGVYGCSREPQMAQRMENHRSTGSVWVGWQDPESTYL